MCHTTPYLIAKCPSPMNLQQGAILAISLILVITISLISMASFKMLLVLNKVVAYENQYNMMHHAAKAAITQMVTNPNTHLAYFTTALNKGVSPKVPALFCLSNTAIYPAPCNNESIYAQHNISVKISLQLINPAALPAPLVDGFDLTASAYLPHKQYSLRHRINISWSDASKTSIASVTPRQWSEMP